jgi:hypothetical protein
MPSQTPSLRVRSAFAWSGTAGTSPSLRHRSCSRPQRYLYIRPMSIFSIRCDRHGVDLTNIDLQLYTYHSRSHRQRGSQQHPRRRPLGCCHPCCLHRPERDYPAGLVPNLGNQLLSGPSTQIYPRDSGHLARSCVYTKAKHHSDSEQTFPNIVPNIGKIKDVKALGRASMSQGRPLRRRPQPPCTPSTLVPAPAACESMPASLPG